MSLQLKRIMSERGFNITRLAEETGMKNANISNLIHGKASPTLDTITRLSKALGVEPWEMLKDPEEGDNEGIICCPKCGTKFKMIE